MLFLLSNIVVSTYYSTGFFLFLKNKIDNIFNQTEWSDSKFDNFFFGFAVVFRVSPIVMGLFASLAVVDASLVAFFGQQFYYISMNKTTIELAKIEKVKLQRKLANYDSPYKHFYNHGFIQNWKEILFPEKVEEHEFVYFEDDHAFEIYLENHKANQFEKTGKKKKEN